MNTNIFPISLGFDQCYVLKSKGIIAVDAGAPKKADKFVRGIKRVSIRHYMIK